MIVPSCSTVLFERIRAGQVEVPGGVRPENYDDLNRLGLRGFFQRSLPDMLASVIELAAHQLIQDLPHSCERVFLLCDRWFPDIYAYTHLESPDEALRADVVARCLSRYDDVLDSLTGLTGTLSMLNVFVPLGASQFPVSGQAGKFRATCDRDAWENACLGHWKKTARSRKALFMMTKTGRRERVNLLLDTLGEEPVDRLTRHPAGERSPRND